MPAGTYGGSGTTVGNVFLAQQTSDASIPPELYVHETIHSDQWAEYGDNYGAIYLFYGGPSERVILLSRGAGIGGYEGEFPLVSTWPQGPP